MSLSEAAAWVEIIGGGGGGIAGLGAVLYRGRHWFQRVDDWRGEVDTWRTDTGTRLDGIEAQLRPNGGGSLHDQVRAVAEHKRQDQTAADLAHVLAMVLAQRQDPPATT